MLAGGAVELFHQLAKTLPRAEEITLNWRLLLYTFSSALAATLVASGRRRGLGGAHRLLWAGVPVASPPAARWH